MAKSNTRQINRLKKESADLWVALTEFECNQNVICASLLHGAQNELTIPLTIEQASKLEKIRERLNQFDDDLQFLIDATDE